MGPRTLSRRQFMALGASSFLAPGMLLAAADELDTAYTNARVWTGVPGAPIAKALGVKGARIPVRPARTWSTSRRFTSV